MRQFSTRFIVLIILCTLISCANKNYEYEIEPLIDIVPMGIIDSHIYTTEIQGHFETPHYAVFAIVYCEVHGGYAPYSEYKTDYPLEIPDTTFGGYPVYNDGKTIRVQMMEHRETDLEGVVINSLAKFHTEVVFIGFCKQGKYKFNVNGFEKEFSVGNIIGPTQY